MSESKRQRIKYIVSDYVSCNIAWIIFNMLRYYTMPDEYGIYSFGIYYSMTVIMLGQILFPMLMVILYAISGSYNDVLKKRSRIDEFINTYGIAFIGAIVIFFIALFNDNIEDRLQNYEILIILWLLIGTFTIIPRLIFTSELKRKIHDRKITFNTLIYGSSKKARRLANELKDKYPDMGFNVVGFINDEHAGETVGSLPVYSMEEATSRVGELNIHSFIIVHDGSDPNHSVSILNKLFPLEKSIYITPDAMHFITMRPRTQTVAGKVLIDVTKSQIPASTQNIKRLSDIIIAAIALIVLSPVLLIIAIMVRKSSSGPIIYRQERIGLHKKPFIIYKFRTMYTDSEAHGPALSSEDDPRITPFGRFMRKYRLDELPQFWNVIKGDMSIVGPRPERAYYLNKIVEKAPYYTLLLQVRPGITSWGMVKYGYASNVDQMVKRAKYDLLYIDNVSLIVDLKILMYTIETVLTGKGI